VSGTEWVFAANVKNTQSLTKQKNNYEFKRRDLESVKRGNRNLC